MRSLCLVRSLVCLALLYRWAWRARPIRDAEWADCLESLPDRDGRPRVALRESRAVGSPLTLGLFRPVILLPAGWRDWSAEQLRLVLAHELAHVRRRDFLAGLVAELAVCLCWFHPLVRWLAGRLRLEQEYAADARAASAAGDAMTYVRCLARLALEQGAGRGSPAPALWRRRPEILRRIDMLRRNRDGLSLRLGWGTAWRGGGAGGGGLRGRRRRRAAPRSRTRRIRRRARRRRAAEVKAPAGRRRARRPAAGRRRWPAWARPAGGTGPTITLRRLRAGRQDAGHRRPGQHRPPVGRGHRPGDPPLRPAGGRPEPQPSAAGLPAAGPPRPPPPPSARRPRSKPRSWRRRRGGSRERPRSAAQARLEAAKPGAEADDAKRKLEAAGRRAGRAGQGRGRRPRSKPSSGSALGGGRRGDLVVAVSPDGKTLAVAGGNVIQLYEVETGKELRKIEDAADRAGRAALLARRQDARRPRRATAASSCGTTDTGEGAAARSRPRRGRTNRAARWSWLRGRRQRHAGHGLHAGRQGPRRSRRPSSRTRPSPAR